ncbi:S8 family serine peptidase [Kribbella sp. HUAS MG21]|jgi:type VII secretion-associated serine protease mycosin|uniref:S8 family serine peptidase n=1 Tax=Kribbella sp. HUAS MG21 TaxID=3160966 RepID=A0AAU7TH42_9ACTN
MRRARVPLKSARFTQILRLGLPAALVAGILVTVTGSSGTAAEPRPFQAKPALGKPTGPAYDAKSVLIKFKPKATTSARKAALSKVKGRPDVSVTSDIVTVTSEAPAPELLKKVKADPAVELASLNYLRRKSATPNDLYYTNYQKYLPTVRANAAWDLSKSAGTQTIGVLDTGVDAGHPDLVGHLLPGYNTFNTAVAPNDGDGHGTATTGIIAAGTGNSIGIAGVAWNAKVRPVKVLDDNGEGSDANLINGINWAVKNGVRVINMSLGGEGDNPILHTAIKNAFAKGVVLVAASGNTGASAPNYPAAYPEVLSVGATNWYGALTSFSSWGDTVDLAAPGFNITSTAPRALTPSGFDPYYRGLSGTSFSSPIVAGVAALVRNKWPSFTPAQVMARLKTTTRDAGPRGIDPYYGNGILDAYQALGGRWTTDFPMNPADGNDQPARATVLPEVPAEVSSTIGVEGDVDWYRVNAADRLTVMLTGPVFDCAFSSNFGPHLNVYDQNLQPLAHAVYPYPTLIDPLTGCPKPMGLTVFRDVPGAIYIAVRNDNGSRDTRAYKLSVRSTTSELLSHGTAYPVTNVQPADLSTNAPVTVKPTVTFARPVVADSVNSSTVRLLNGQTGAVVPTTVAYDATTRQAVITPAWPPSDATPSDPATLLDNTPYRISVTGAKEADGTPLASISSTFSTVDTAPPTISPFNAAGAYLAANLSWGIAPTTDLDQVIVRRNAGSTVPTPTTGTLVYSGTGTAVKDTGLAQGVTYTYAVWARDRSGRYSTAHVQRLMGMKSGISTTSTLVTYGSTFTLRGSLLRIDNKAFYGLPVHVYARPKTSSRFTLLGSPKTSVSGTVSWPVKPSVSSVYMMTFPGNAEMMGTRTADITVNVAPTISATLSPSSIRLGGTAAFSGYVAPAHAGQTVYLQQYANKVWKSIAAVKLSTSGKYAFGIKPTVRGQIAYRVWFPGDADHTPAYTTNKILTIS